jgi:hypothetical protein
MAGGDEELETIWTAIRQRHGAGLGEPELADLRRSVEGLVDLVRALRRVPLANAVAPLETFAPHRADGATRA